MKRLKVTVSGRVQGVGYRAFARENAKLFGLNGFVKNLMNGKVIIEAQGPEGQVDLFMSTCKKGPPWARVDDFDVVEIPLADDSNFSVKY